MTTASHRRSAERTAEDCTGLNGERRLKLLINSIPAWISYIGADGRYRFANERYIDLVGQPGTELVGKHLKDVIGEQAYAVSAPHLARALAGEKTSYDNLIPKPGGGKRHVQIELIPDIENGSANGVFTLATDITNRKQAEAALQTAHDELEKRFVEQTAELRESEQLFRRIYEDGQVGMVMAVPDGRIISANDSFSKMLGYSRDELQNLKVRDLTHPDDVADSHASLKKIFDDNAQTQRLEKRYVKKSGDLIWANVTLSPVRGNDGQPRYSVSIVEDITERKNAEAAIRDSERRFRRIFEDSPLGMAISERFGNLEDVNEAFCRMLGYTREELRQLNMADVTHPDDVGKSFQNVERVYSGRSPVSEIEKRYITKSGEVVWARTTLSAVVDDDRTVEYDVAIVEDITEAKRIRETLQVAQERMRAFLENTPDGLLMKDTEGRIVDINRVHMQWHATSQESVIGKTAYDLYPPEIADKITAEDKQVLETGSPVKFEREVPFRDGSRRVLEQMKFPIRDGNGQIIALGSVNRDVTAQRDAEAQLRAAQRMEAVGRLTGGVAHDFNNLLAIIIGNLEMALDGPDNVAEMRRRIERAVRAADKGGTLVQRLLAFSRTQTLAPKVVRVSDVVEGMTDMLRQSLSEAVTIDLESPKDLWDCKVDPAQLENSLLNLTVNAGDAMPEGGVFRIECSNVSLDKRTARKIELPAGDFVRLRISDTGRGMPPEILPRVVEPFFTTKQFGQGTGLGLSTVHGFVTQSGGHLIIDSEPGSGTRVDIYLPRETGRHAHQPDRADPVDVPKGSGETVLIVEDDPMVRDLVVSQIAALGYNAIEAEDGPRAIELAADLESIDLLLTDVVLPNGMNGRRVAEKIRADRPEVSVLFMSGYSDDVFDEHDRPEEFGPLIQKPFRANQIAQAISAALQQP